MNYNSWLAYLRFFMINLQDATVVTCVELVEF